MKLRPLLFLAFLVPLAGCGGSHHHAATDAGGELGVRSIDLFTNQIALDATRDILWASVPGAGGFGTAVMAIDPASGTQIRSVQMFARPDALAISDDGSTLYVGLNDIARIGRVDLATNFALAPLELPPLLSPGTQYAVDLAVQPGHSNVVAATTRLLNATENLGLVVYRDDTILSNRVQNPLLTQIAWPTAARIVAADASITTSTLSAVGVNDSGANLLFQTAYPGEVNTNDLVAAGDRIYAPDGSVLDADNLNVLGHFAIVDRWIPYGPAVDTVRHRAYFVNLAQDGATSLQVFDTQTFTRLGQSTLPTIDDTDVPSTEGRSNLLRWGSRGLALRTRSKVVFIDNIPQP